MTIEQHLRLPNPIRLTCLALSLLAFFLLGSVISELVGIGRYPELDIPFTGL